MKIYEVKTTITQVGAQTRNVTRLYTSQRLMTHMGVEHMLEGQSITKAGRRQRPVRAVIHKTHTCLRVIIIPEAMIRQQMMHDREVARQSTE